MNGLERVGVDRRAVDQDLLEHLPHLEVVLVALVVEDVAARDRGVVQMPDQHFLAQRERLEAVGVDLCDGGVADALEQVPARLRFNGGSGRRIRFGGRGGGRIRFDGGGGGRVRVDRSRGLHLRLLRRMEVRCHPESQNAQGNADWDNRSRTHHRDPPGSTRHGRIEAFLNYSGGRIAP